MTTASISAGCLPSPSPNTALLSFMIGQVQPFIEAARTVRDLWTGSYLMSWLTAAAMKPIIQKCGHAAIITPHVDADNPLLRALLQGPTGDDRATLPSLPNKFSAEVPQDQATQLRDECLAASREEWKRIAQAVHDRLAPVFSDWDAGWDRNWEQQIASYLEMRCVVRPVSGDADAWCAEWDGLGALLEMTRAIRHLPDYRPVSENGRVPGKCALLGTFEQMGPAELDRSRAFWEAASDPKVWKGLHGSRLHGNDRFCAVSLVKRFAWPAYFARTNDGRGKLGVAVGNLRYSDTATVAAALWLPNPADIPDDPDDTDNQDALDWHTLRRWSGQWLHWKTRDQEQDEPPCPQRVWDAIQARKRTNKQPPLYYAVLLMDADGMGEMFQGKRGPDTWGTGRVRYNNITRLLTTFSLTEVKPIVEAHGGELIYAGGDDVLAFLPTSTVVDCAHKIREALRRSAYLGADGSISAGVAVVHYKEDLRFALEQARGAEKAAKQVGKLQGDPMVKDALGMVVCRRSGEHQTVVLGWDQAQPLSALVADFANDASNRWTYKLRAELPTLQNLPLALGEAEARRLVHRVEAAPENFATGVMALFDAYRQEMQKPQRNWPDAKILQGFVTLCQSASFLARGRD